MKSYMTTIVNHMSYINVVNIVFFCVVRRTTVNILFSNILKRQSIKNEVNLLASRKRLVFF